MLIEEGFHPYCPIVWDPYIILHEPSVLFFNSLLLLHINHDIVNPLLLQDITSNILRLERTFSRRPLFHNWQHLSLDVASTKPICCYPPHHHWSMDWLMPRWRSTMACVRSHPSLSVTATQVATTSLNSQLDARAQECPRISVTATQIPGGKQMPCHVVWSLLKTTTQVV